MQQQEQRSKPTHNFVLDNDTYFAIKQLSLRRGDKYPSSLIAEILKSYIEEHRKLLLAI